MPLCDQASLDPLIKNSWIRSCVPSRDPFCQRHLIRGRIAILLKILNSNFYILLTHNVTVVTGILVVVVVVVCRFPLLRATKASKKTTNFCFLHILFMLSNNNSKTTNRTSHIIKAASFFFLPPVKFKDKKTLRKFKFFAKPKRGALPYHLLFCAILCVD